MTAYTSSVILNLRMRSIILLSKSRVIDSQSNGNSIDSSILRMCSLKVILASIIEHRLYTTKHYTGEEKRQPQ